MKISGLYGKRAISSDKKLSGTILGISCIGDKIEGFICCDESEREFFALSEGARCGKDIMRFEKTGKESGKGFRLRLGLPVYTSSGKFLGNLEECTARGNVIIGVRCKKTQYPFGKLAFGDVVILKCEEDCAKDEAKDMFISAICGG